MLGRCKGSGLSRALLFAQNALAKCKELATKFVFAKDEAVPPLTVTGMPCITDLVTTCSPDSTCCPAWLVPCDAPEQIQMFFFGILCWGHVGKRSQDEANAGAAATQRHNPAPHT